MAGQVATRASFDALSQDEYAGASAPKKTKKKSAKKGKRGKIRNAPPPAQGQIAKAMGAKPC